MTLELRWLRETAAVQVWALLPALSIARLSDCQSPPAMKA